MKCPRCGGNIPSGATSCGSCGARLTYRQPQGQTAARGVQSATIPTTAKKTVQQQKKTKGKFQWWQIPIYILIFTIGCGVGSSYTKNSINSAISDAFKDSLSSSQSSKTSEDSKTSEANESSSKESSVASEVAANTEPVASDSGTLGDYSVSILHSRKTNDYEGKPALVVGYKFTNNSSENKSFAIAIHPQAYQNSVQLESAILAGSDDSFNSQNYLKDVQPGGTLEVEMAYLLENETSEVTVEVTELISFSKEKLTKKFSLG